MADVRVNGIVQVLEIAWDYPGTDPDSTLLLVQKHHHQANLRREQGGQINANPRLTKSGFGVLGPSASMPSGRVSIESTEETAFRPSW